MTAFEYSAQGYRVAPYIADLGKKEAAAGTKAPETEPARCYTLMCTGDLGTAPVMVFRNEGDANDMMRALEQVAKVTSPDTVYDVMEAPFKEAI